MRLYTYFRSSAAYRVRIALNLKGVAYEAVPVHLTREGGEHKRQAFRELNPQGLVPVIDDDGIVLSQSLAIIEYLDSRFPEPSLIPVEPVDRARVQAMAQIIACEIHPLNNLRVLQYLRRDLGLEEAAVKRWYAHWIAEAFRGFEVLVERYSAGEYCYRDRLSLADVCLVPQVFNARRFECDLTAYPRLVEIAERLGVQPAFVEAAPANQPDAE
jgi:maleylacetoacetate isomerase